MPTLVVSRRSFLKATALAAVAAAVFFPARHLLRSSKAERVYLHPFGPELARTDVDRIQSALVAVYGISVGVLPVLPLPWAAFYAPRNRYRAERLLEVLGARLPDDGTRILGLTGADISTTKSGTYDWGVLGLAHVASTSGVVSSFRCARGARDAAHARERFAKVAVHELGHCFGLSHCPTARCIMQDAEGKIATIDDSTDVCDTCRANLAAEGIHVTAQRLAPWSH
jgi:archaemetzincin